MLKTILCRFICCNKKKSYQTVFEKSCKICKSRSFSAYIGQFDLLRAIQAKWRLDMLNVYDASFAAKRKKVIRQFLRKLALSAEKAHFCLKKAIER